MTAVLVLNAAASAAGDDDALQYVTVRHAIAMIVRGVAVIEEHLDGVTFGPFPMPRVLRLVRRVVADWIGRRGPVRFSRDAVKQRDRVCGYCGGPAQTVDHIFPASRGGATSWMNLVAACEPCNFFKAARTPREAGMALFIEPFIPTTYDELVGTTS